MFNVVKEIIHWEVAFVQRVKKLYMVSIQNQNQSHYQNHLHCRHRQIYPQ